MANLIQAVRGMNDILPPETSLWQYAEHILRKVVRGYGYHEIRFPIVEKTELFKRSIGEATDIVEKEMYTFIDRQQDSLTLRPEGTAVCVRAGIEHGLLYNQIQRLWYYGPYFRHERPQKGRYRQFYQFGAEVFGLAGPEIDAEIIMMSATILDKLGVKSFVTLNINTLGTVSARQAYRKLLIQYFNKHKDQLDEDSLKRLDKNPLRILDSKNPELKTLIANAPKLLDHLDDESEEHFSKLQIYLRKAGIDYVIDPTLVRGLDYYTKTVFEWTTNKLGSQSAVCSGGRFDGLVEQLGGKATPALGFAIGMERIVLLMQQNERVRKFETTPHVYFITDGEAAFAMGLKNAQYLRNKVTGLKVVMHCGGGSVKNQLKKADKSGAQYAVILGEYELKSQSLLLKNLRENVQQQSIYPDELAEYLKLKIHTKT